MKQSSHHPNKYQGEYRETANEASQQRNMLTNINHINQNVRQNNEMNSQDQQNNFAKKVNSSKKSPVGINSYQTQNPQVMATHKQQTGLNSKGTQNQAINFKHRQISQNNTPDRQIQQNLPVKSQKSNLQYKENQKADTFSPNVDHSPAYGYGGASQGIPPQKQSNYNGQKSYFENKKRSLDIQVQVSKSNKNSPSSSHQMKLQNNLGQNPSAQTYSQNQVPIKISAQPNPLKVNNQKLNCQEGTFESSGQQKHQEGGIPQNGNHNNFYKHSQQFSIDSNLSNLINQYSLRIPLNEREASFQMKDIHQPPQFFGERASYQPAYNQSNIQTALITPPNQQLFQSQVVEGQARSFMRKGSQSSQPGNLNFINQQSFDNENNTYDRTSMDLGQQSSINHSFINSIYPSMSKKIISNQQEGESVDRAQAHLNQKHPHQGYHQKSKSVFTGGLINGGPQPFSQFHQYNNAQLNQGVQKVNMSNYKKQSSIFNYSNRLKELLTDNGQESQDQIESSESNVQMRQKLFSQQPSPVNSQSLIHFKIQDLTLQEKSVDNVKQQRSQIQNTFENIVAQANIQTKLTQDYAQPNLKASKIQLSQDKISHTLDIQYNYKDQNKKDAYDMNQVDRYQLKAQTQVSSPVNQQSSSHTKIHQPKFSQDKIFIPDNSRGQAQPSFNHHSNYIMQDSLQTQQQTYQEHTSRYQARRGSNCSSVDQENLLVEAQQAYQYQQVFGNQQNQVPLREKKQHQPTQSKILNNSKSGSIQAKVNQNFHHQRSQSDYVNHLQFVPSTLGLTIEQDSLKTLHNQVSSNLEDLYGAQTGPRFNRLEYETYDVYKQQVSLQQQEIKRPQFKIQIGAEKEKGQHSSSSFLQHYSQALNEAQQSITKQNLKSIQNKQIQSKKEKKLSFVENVQNSSHTLNQQNHDVNPKSSIYHQRKLSYQHPGQYAQAQINLSKKSPISSTLQSKELAAKNASTFKRKISPKPNSTNQTIQNTSRPQIQTSTKNAYAPSHHHTKATASTSLKNSQISSPSQGFGLRPQSSSSKSNLHIQHHSQYTKSFAGFQRQAQNSGATYQNSNLSKVNLMQQNMSQQIKGMQNSLNQSNGKQAHTFVVFGNNQHHTQEMIAGEASKSMSKENNKSSKDLKSKIISNAAKNYKDNLKSCSNANSSNVVVGKLNLQGMTGQIKKSIQSEKTSPRIFMQPDQSYVNKKIANVSINLSKASFTQNHSYLNSASNQVSAQSFVALSQANTQQILRSNTIAQKQQVHQKQHSKFSLQKSDSHYIHNEILARKNSSALPTPSNQSQGNLIKVASKINLDSQRDISPQHCTHRINFHQKNEDTQSLMLNDKIISNSTIQIQSQPQGLSGHRYSVQNSPQKNHSIFQKTLKQSHHLKTNSMSNIIVQNQSLQNLTQVKNHQSMIAKPQSAAVSPREFQNCFNFQQHQIQGAAYQEGVQRPQNQNCQQSQRIYQLNPNVLNGQVYHNFVQNFMNQNNSQSHLLMNNNLNISANTPADPSFADEESLCINNKRQFEKQQQQQQMNLSHQIKIQSDQLKNSKYFQNSKQSNQQSEMVQDQSSKDMQRGYQYEQNTQRRQNEEKPQVKQLNQSYAEGQVENLIAPRGHKFSHSQFIGSPTDQEKFIQQIQAIPDIKHLQKQAQLFINQQNSIAKTHLKVQESQKISETEHLLNQIRSNILKNKGDKYKISDSSASESLDIQKNQHNFYPQNDQNRLSEISEGQLLVEKALERREPRRETIYERKNANLPSYSSIGNFEQSQKKLELQETNAFYLTTDPNLSPCSKDKFKLHKLISLNFKKFNEAPQTTSEFYRIGRVLGRGAFGKVNLAAHKISEQLVAIKSINKEFLKCEEDQKKKIMQEFAILKQSTHQSVVRLYDTFETSKHICFVMELCSGGDLLTYVRKRRKLKEDVAKYFFKQIIEGLAYIHNSKLIVHRDIKLDNILLDANGKIKICDFGVSKQVSSETEKMTEQCGTPAYIAPEILKDKGYEGFKVDVWSAGVCLYAMLIGTVPFKAGSMQELHDLIVNGKYEIKPEEKLSDSALNLIAALLQVDPKKRLGAYEVLSHPWLKDAQVEMDIFTQKEKDTIQKEYLSKNLDRVKSPNQQFNQTLQTEVVFTEHNLDTKSNSNSLLKNASTKSIILAPFNSTVSEDEEQDNEDAKQQLKDWPDEVKKMLLPKRIIKFAPKCKDLDRQYEQNNNADLDNGVYNNCANDEENKSENDKESKNSSRRGNSRSSSLDSLKKSFKETELSSDDERAEMQIQKARDNQIQQQSELQEFERHLKGNRYQKYEEPVQKIDEEVVSIIVGKGLYPREYLLHALQSKEMNYATATYFLLSKKKQMMAKLFGDQMENKDSQMNNY